jgi:hypothetical protein
MSKLAFSFARSSRISSVISTTKSFQSSMTQFFPLEGLDRTNKLKALDGWKVLDDRDAIQKTYLFKDFIQVCRIDCFKPITQ